MFRRKDKPKFTRKDKLQLAGNRHRSKHNPNGMVDELLIQQVRTLSEKGFTQREIASFFKVGLSTLEYWLKNKPELKQAVKEGREIADAKVERALYEKATGFKIKEMKVFSHEGMIISEEFDKELPPDTGAAIFWLKNRKPEMWADTQRVSMNHSGTLNHVQVTDIPVNQLSEQEQELLFNLNLKQIQQGRNNN